MKSLNFTLKQTSKFMWTIISPKGNVVCLDRYFKSRYEAEQYCRAFISSWISASYSVVELKE